MNILKYNSINLNQTPHFIQHILRFSGHSNCFPSNYEEKWLPFLGLHRMTAEFQTLRTHTKIRMFILTNTTCTRKSDTVFQFRDIPIKKYITPSLPGQNTSNLTVRTIHARSRPTESYMNVNTRTVRERVSNELLYLPLYPKPFA